jgi:predicted nucleic acid-binding Zn ribbon protein
MFKSNENSLKDVLTLMVNRLNMKPGLYQNRLQKIWQEKMGATIAGHTKELKLYKNRLFLTIDSAPLKQDLSFSREKIIDMLNEALGEEYIEDVIIR